MIITLRRDADADRVRGRMQALGLWTRPLSGRRGERGLLVLPHSRPVGPAELAGIEGVDDVLDEASAHPLLDALRGRPVELGLGVRIGAGERTVLMAGPCAAESEEQLHAAAAAVSRAGARVLRGGAFKPRTSPHSFSGHGLQALRWLRDAARGKGLLLATEAMSERHAEAVARYADVVQIGSRNMQNFALLHEVGGLGMPVLLKRGMSATVEEWLLAGEHLLAAGAPAVVFCERGVVGFDPQTRNLLDLGAVALLRHAYGLPVVVDPSHATGRRDLIAPLAAAAVAAGASGLMVEMHPDAAAARSDGPQALAPGELMALAEALPTPAPAPAREEERHG